MSDDVKNKITVNDLVASNIVVSSKKRKPNSLWPTHFFQLQNMVLTVLSAPDTNLGFRFIAGRVHCMDDECFVVLNFGFTIINPIGDGDGVAQISIAMPSFRPSGFAAPVTMVKPYVEPTLPFDAVFGQIYWDGGNNNARLQIKIDNKTGYYFSTVCFHTTQLNSN